EQVRVRTWMDRYGSLYQAIAVQKLTMFFLLLFLVAVAAFNLVSGLVMIVEQRKADIAVLMTLGLDARGVLLVFINLGVVMAVLGIGLGLTAGGVLAMLLPGLFSSLSELFSAQLMSQYFINYLPSEVRPLDLVVIGGISFLLAGLATLFPAWRATRVLPSEVLNHE
ncbi:MAG: FtsX-like permease family protein, partial [Pseudomonadales bacterium]